MLDTRTEAFHHCGTMRLNTYLVIFSADNWKVTVDAFTAKEARILAQSDRIRAGLDYRIKSCVQVGE